MGADGEMQTEEAEPTTEGNSPDESPSGEETVPLVFFIFYYNTYIFI